MRIVVISPVLGKYQEQFEDETNYLHDWAFVKSTDVLSTTDIEQADILVASSVTSDILQKATQLKLLQVPGAGYEKIPISSLRTTRLANTSHHGRSIAEHVIMVSLAFSRNLISSDSLMRGGTWSNAMTTDATTFDSVLRGKTMGIVGYGSIGQEIATLAQSFGMRTLGVRRNVRGNERHLLWCGGMDEIDHLLESSNFLVLAIPEAPGTTGLIGPKELSRLRSDSTIINVSRGMLIDEDALYAALHHRRIRGAALDVWWDEEGATQGALPYTQPFNVLDNVIMTPHKSGHTDETFDRRADDIVYNVNAIYRGSAIRNEISL